MRDNILFLSPSGEGESGREFVSRLKLTFRVNDRDSHNCHEETRESSHDCAIECFKLSLELHLSRSSDATGEFKRFSFSNRFSVSPLLEWNPLFLCELSHTQNGTLRVRVVRLRVTAGC